MVSATPSSVEDEGSVVMWHPGHCGAISAASALEVRASRDGDSSGDFEAPEDAEDLDRSLLVDIVRAALAPNVETGGAAAFEARRRDGLWGYSRPIPLCGRMPQCFSL